MQVQPDHPSTEIPPLPKNRAWLRRLPFLVILVVAVVGTVLLRDWLDFDALARHQADLIAYRDAHYLLAVLGFILAYLVIVSFSLPGATIATLAGGFLFGLFPGVVFNVLAAGTGAVIVFLAARAGFGQELSLRLAKGDGRVARLAARMADNEWSVLFLMRLVPVVPFFLANLVPAMIGTSLWRYAVTTYLGILPGGLVFTAFGAGLGEVFARGEAPDLGLLSNPKLIAPLIGLVALAALPMILKTLRKGH